MPQMTEIPVPGEAQGADDAQKLWDEVAQEREAAEAPSNAPAPAPAPAEEEQTAEQTAAPAAPAATDPFEGLPAEVRKRLDSVAQHEQLLSQIPTLVQSVKTAEGRVSAIQRELDAAKAAAKSASQAPTQAQIAQAAKNPEKWDSLKSDFPEWAEATEAFVDAKLAGLSAQQTAGLSAEQVQQLVAEQASKIEASTAAKIEEARVEGKYENWVEVINTDDFKTWFGTQTGEVQALAKSPKGRDAIRLLDLFNEAKAAPAAAVEEQRSNRLAAAVNTTPKQPVPAAKTVDQMSPAELWEYERKRAAKRGPDRGLTY